MARITLISPPYQSVYGGINLSMASMAQPPLGLAYVAAVLANQGHRVGMHDAQFFRDPRAEVERIVTQEAPDFVGLTSTTPQWNQALALAQVAKQARPQAQVVAGGSHVSALPEEAARAPGIDLVVRGEGERTMAELAEGRPWEEIRGLNWSEQGQARSTEDRPLLEDLDALPFPLVDQLPLEKYCYPHMGPSLVVLSRRGCPHRCASCASGVINKRRARQRSASNFVDELEHLRWKRGVRRFRFVDETFCLDAQRVLRICDEIRARQLGITWCCTTTVQSLDDALLGAMRAAGCSLIEIGVESASPRVRRWARKRITLDKVAQVTRWAHGHGIRVSGDFILGLPGESPETLLQTIDFARRSQLDYAQFALLVPLPGTEIWDMVQRGEALRSLATDWDDYSRYGEAIVESDQLDRETLTRHHRIAVRRFYLQPGRIARTLLRAWRPADLARLALAGLAFGSFALRPR